MRLLSEVEMPGKICRLKQNDEIQKLKNTNLQRQVLSVLPHSYSEIISRRNFSKSPALPVMFPLQTGQWSG